MSCHPEIPCLRHHQQHHHHRSPPPQDTTTPDDHNDTPFTTNSRRRKEVTTMTMWSLMLMLLYCLVEHCINGVDASSLSDVPSDPFLELWGRRLGHKEKIVIKEHKLIAIRCVVYKSSPAVKSMDWFIDGHNMSHSSQLLMEYSPEDDSFQSQSILVLNVSKDLHKKSVDCISIHDSWLKPIKVTATFDVLYEPSFSLSREPGFGNPIMEGMSVSLKCEIDANPWSPPKWIKDGGTGGGEFSLNSLPSASQSSAGGSSASSLSSSGGVNQSKNSYSSQSLSPEEIKSLRNQSSGPASLTSSSKLLRSSLFESETGVITIPSAKISDTGWYRCTTDHEFGHFTSNAYYLNIRYGSAAEASSGQIPSTSHSAVISSASSHASSSSSANGTSSAAGGSGGVLSSSIECAYDCAMVGAIVGFVVGLLVVAIGVFGILATKMCSFNSHHSGVDRNSINMTSEPTTWTADTPRSFIVSTSVASPAAKRYG